MAKTLCVKGADFSTNKLTTVQFGGGGSVPCTGISFSQNTFSFTDYTSAEIEYTLTPSNTTDTMTWATSDNSVATVSGGVVTPAGLGTATITATCGTQTATATVTVAIVFTDTYAGNCKFGFDDSRNIITVGGSSGRMSAYGTGDLETTYCAINTSSWAEPMHGIKLPANTVKVKISRNVNKGNLFYDQSYSAGIRWAHDVHNGDPDRPLAITPVSSATEYNIRSTAVEEVAVPEGADSVFITFRTANTTSDFDALVEEAELEISFLAS